MNDDNELDPVARLRAADPAAGVEPRAGFADEVVARAATAEATAATAARARAAAESPTSASERARRRPRWLPSPRSPRRSRSSAVPGSASVHRRAGRRTSPTALRPDLAADRRERRMARCRARRPTGAGCGADQRRCQPVRAPTDMMRTPTASVATASARPGSSTAGGHGAGVRLRRARRVERRDRRRARRRARRRGNRRAEGRQLDRGPAGRHRPVLERRPRRHARLLVLEPADRPMEAAPRSAKRPADDRREPMRPADADAQRGGRDRRAALAHRVGRARPDAFEYTSETWEGAVTRTAQAWPVVDGQRIDQAWSLELTEAGVSSAYGALADLVDARRIRRRQRAGGVRAALRPAVRRADDGDAVRRAPSAPRRRSRGVGASDRAAGDARPTGTSVSWPVNDVEIVSARLGLASQWQPDGSVLVVPAYEFTDADGGAWSVIAVADSKLDFATD